MSLLINALLADKVISPQQLEEAKEKQIGAKRPLHEILIEMGYLDEEKLVQIASETFNLGIVTLNNQTVDAEALKILPYNLAKKYGAFPLRMENEHLLLAMSNPQDIDAVEDMRAVTGLEIKTLFCKKSDIDLHIEKHYHADDSIYDLLKDINENSSIGRIDDLIAHQDMKETNLFKNEESPLVRLVQMIIFDAVKARVSDIHIEPYETFVTVRYRVDGLLKQIMKIPRKMQSSVAVRIKVLADLDISETRKPQDGRSRVTINNKTIDLRISTVPTFHGEKIVIRLLDSKVAQIKLENIGLDVDEIAQLKKHVQRPQGIVLITGPTGSGKTTTIYATLDYVKSETKNIITVEDPIEYLIEGINQIQVNRAKEVTFASGLRSILRQDPNIILVGEVRVVETAEIAFRASLTGHLVLTTLHTNDAVSSIVRLKDLGLEPYLISSALLVVVAQRLVRVICPDCKAEYQPEERILKKFNQYIKKHQIDKFYKGKGCEKCSYSGFKGRSAIYELLEVNDRIRQLIIDNAREDEISREALAHGMKFLSESGALKVKKGITTFDEVEFVCNVQEEAVIDPAVNKVEQVYEVAGNQETILVVDDEEDIRKILCLRLSKAGYKVIQAQNGAEAIEMTFRDRPNLIIMDVMMPRMNGFEAVKVLRSTLETATIPIMMLTAKKDKESELTGLDVGADDYLTKPYDFERLILRVRVLLRRAQGRR